MKYLLYRMTALLLAVLLFCSAGAELALAAPGQPDPDCVLGTTPADMLAGGGSFVRTERGTYYIEEADGGVYLLGDAENRILAGPAAKLNYADGVLYYARTEEEGVFHICSYDLRRGEETVLLKSFSGALGQLYLVGGRYIDFSCDNAVWQLDLETDDYRLILFARDLWSFVPTGCGLIYAVGTLFDYDLYADGVLLAEHVSDYDVRFDLEDGLVVYTQSFQDYQTDLAAAFAGVVQPVAFRGEPAAYTELSSDSEQSDEEAQLALEAEMQQFEADMAEILARPENRPRNAEPAAAPPDPAEAGPDDPQLPADLIPETPEEAPEDEAPTEPAEEPAEPAEEPAEPAEAPTEPVEPAEEPVEAPAEPIEEPGEAPAEPVEPEAAEPVEAGDPADNENRETDETPAEEPAGPEPAAPADEPAAPAAISGDADAEEPLINFVDPPAIPTAVFSDGVIRPPMATGQQNIVKRARQMLNIKWTPRKGVGGWGYYDSSYSLRIYYSAGVTYTGLPYGQCVNGSYVPWSTSLSEFAAAVKNPNSKMYTTRNSYGRGSQYYGTDCSGFVSWAWQTGSRKTCTSLIDWSNTICVGTSYTSLRIGDALISSSHTRLVTDVTYYPSGAIASVELSEANPTGTHNGCCYSTRYSGTSALQSLEKSYTNNKYKIYRNSNAASVSYTHCCDVPLEGDVCPICGCGVEDPDLPVDTEAKMGVDVSYAQGTVSWSTAASDVSFALIRVGYTGNTEGKIYKDSQFENNVAGCEANDIPYGLYFYAGATTPEKAMEEADAVLSWVAEAGCRPDMPIFYDIEEAKNILKLTDTQILAAATAFCSMVEDYGYRAGVYASANTWKTRLSSEAYSQWGRWVAQWDSDSMSVSGGASVWQFSSTGSVPGITQAVDLDFWLEDLGSSFFPSVAVKTNPTCTAEGTLKTTCVVNGEITERTIPAAGHAAGTAVEENLVSPTCTEAGSYDAVTYCTVCGEEASRKTLPLDPLGHSFEDGWCTRCGKKETVYDRYEDVNEGKWYSRAIEFVVENGLFSGAKPNYFNRNKAMDRAMMVTVLYSLAGSPAVEAEDLFHDVSPNSYCYLPVVWASHAGIVTGTGIATFSPKQSVTREQVALMLYNYLLSLDPEITVETDLSAYPDAEDVHSYAETAMAWAVENEIISGNSVDGELWLCPRNGATRAQVAVMIMQFANLLEARGFWPVEKDER